MAVTQHGLKCSSESARKLLSAIGVSISGDTVLRDIHRISVPERCEVKEIGVDDWAFRKGVTYGSIIVSLETGSVIDLLGDRDVSSFQTWLDGHSQVAIVSRDRSTDYTAAIAATGRNITEVADRFHLNMNMSACVTKVISSHYDEYRSTVCPAEVQETPKVDSRQIMFNEVKELQAEGLNIAQISQKLDIARQTVRKYMGWDTLPKRASKERLPYFLYDTYVEEEYRHGKDLRKIFLEIKEKGFRGSLTPFYDHYSYLSDGHHGYRPTHEVEKMKNAPRSDREPLLPIRQIAHIVDKSIRKKKMVKDEVTLVEKMMSFGWFRDIYNAASSFYATIMGDDINDLDTWLENYGKSPIQEPEVVCIWYQNGSEGCSKCYRAGNIQRHRGRLREQIERSEESNVWAGLTQSAQTENGLQRPMLQLNCGRTTFFRERHGVYFRKNELTKKSFRVYFSRAVQPC
uniref:Transposase IS204/IS1001/IS1096/IS1165 DDE domain-containing protein n=1 Tax=uncultured bacterium Lq_025_E06 TaxID=1489290 RepID=A0A0B4N1K2_9BACT|nr:putative hypothetical protein [uncultured bacterium Lq_025_E06]